MLGFAKDATSTRGVKADGTFPVDVHHHNLRFVKLSADIVDKSNVCFEGKRIEIFASLPVETQQRLFSTRKVYSELDICVPIVRNFSTIKFELGTNIENWDVQMDALLDLDLV